MSNTVKTVRIVCPLVLWQRPGPQYVEFYFEEDGAECTLAAIHRDTWDADPVLQDELRRALGGSLARMWAEA